MNDDKNEPAIEQTEPSPSGATPKETAAPATGAPPDDRTAKERLYDKIPITFKQADILVKVLLFAFAVVLVIAVLSGGLFR